MKPSGRREFLRCASLGVLGLAAHELLEPVEAAALDAEPRRPGRRWAMVIDTRTCRKERGCRACIDACHRAHNVPSIPDRKHEVKWLWHERFRDAFADQEIEHAPPDLVEAPVLVACNHCDKPPCAKVCPTGATWRRDDGVVMMDWHRCIGCRYCMAACPYGSRSFNWVDPRKHLAAADPSFPTRTRGVVEKCTLCHERIDAGRPPACVEGCPERAFTFGDLNDPASPVRVLLRTQFALRRRPGLGTHPELYYLV